MLRLWLCLVLGLLCSIRLVMAAQEPMLSQQDIDKFGHSMQIVKALYVDDVSHKKILENAIEGMLANLDPHSDYLNEEELKALKTATEGNFSGVGIEVTMQHGVVRVVTPLDDTPAQKAGLKPGDLIVRVDGKSIRGMKLFDIVTMMRGKAGTKLDLTVLRKGEKKPMHLTLTRAKITLDSVKSRLERGDYGYIRVSRFQLDTGKAVEEAVEKLQKASKGKLKGIVLDLRNNPGGVLDAAVEVSDVFLDANKIGHGKKIVYTKGRLPDSNIEGIATTPDQLNGLPVVVLINMGSASAAEIVAGALQDHKRAVIVGIRSFGKGSVQTLLPLPDKKTAVKLTTARYYTPAGQAIQAEGVTPDVVVEALEVPETAKPAEDFFAREQSLQGSLKSEKGPLTEEQAKSEDLALMNELAADEKAEKETPLIYKDYQLHEALNLLQGLSIHHQMTKKRGR